MLLYDSINQEDSHSIQAILTEKCRVMIIPFVFVCTVRFIGELQLMKPHISKPKIDLLYYLLNDRKIRRIRDCVLFLICIPSYYSLFCICSGFFNYNDIFIVIFGLLCFVGIFGETASVRIFAEMGVLSSIVQYIFVKAKERESLKYI